MQKREFQKLISEVCILTGHSNISENILDVFYEKLKIYDFKDFYKACQDDELLFELSHQKFNYFSIKLVVEKHKNERLKAEEQKKQKKERMETLKIIKKEGIPQEVKNLIRNGFRL